MYDISFTPLIFLGIVIGLGIGLVCFGFYHLLIYLIAHLVWV